MRRSYSARGNDKRDTRYYRLCFACDAFYQSCCDILKDLYFSLNLDGLFVRSEVPVYSVKIMMERVRPSVRLLNEFLHSSTSVEACKITCCLD